LKVDVVLRNEEGGLTELTIGNLVAEIEVPLRPRAR